jgi:7SK snRNA methylphosphate capping enzyme
MKKEWFEGKDVLDLGCNTGHLTLTIAKDYSPNLVIGMDIDDSLIQIARKNTKYYVTSEVPNTEPYPSSLPLCHGPIAPPSGLPSADSNVDNRFPSNVVFVSGNYALEHDDQLSEQVAEYDCVLCLSLTKWIHLNWGDEALKRTFKRIFRQLRPGGRLVLEAQPWCSYTKKHSITEAIDNTYRSIQFKPEHFNEYLLSKEVGFSMCELIDTPDHESKGFRRPIYMLTKSDSN